MRTESKLLAAAVVAILACVAGGVALFDAASGDARSAEPTTTELDFTDVTDDARFDYAAEDSAGMGNGNDGVYVADVDNDLRSDVLAIGGPGPVLFENRDGTFERSDALPSVNGTVQGALFVDYDNDGWEDLLLLRRGDAPVFLENEEGSFRAVDVGLDRELAVPVTASAADYTGNGCPDLFVAQYGDWDETTPTGWQRSFAFEGSEDNGNANSLYRGDCDGFERADGAGIEGDHWSLAASFADLNGDGAPDVHVANDYYNDTVYWNDGGGTFTRETLDAATDRNGMSSEVADVTGDGRLDVFVTNIYFPEDLSELDEEQRRVFSDFLNNRLGKRAAGNNLLVGTADGFETQGEARGLAEGGWGWAAVLADLDSDGDLDAFHGTQNVITFDESERTFPTPMLWVNEDGTFHRQDATASGFAVTNDRGVAGADFDGDGAVDLATATYDGEYRLYRNDAGQGNSLQVALGPGDSNTTALGARVTVTVDGETLTRVNDDEADYQSQDSRVRHFGLGDADAVDRLRVEWADGSVTVVEDVAAGARILVTPDGIERREPYAD